MATLTGIELGIIALTVILYAYVSAIIAQRNISGEEKWANLSFAAWWGLLAVSTGLPLILAVLAWTSLANFEVAVFLSAVSLLVTVIALACLLFYLLYLYTGRLTVAWPIIGFHLFLWLFFAYLTLFWMHPSGLDGGGAIEYGRPLEGPMLWAALGGLLGPVILAAVAYGSLFFRLKSKAARYRVALVSSAFLLWFGVAAGGVVAGVSDATWWPIVSRTVAMIAPLLVILAYRPPRIVSRRLNANGVAERS